MTFLNFYCHWAKHGVSEMAQKVIEGDVVFSILIGRFFTRSIKIEDKKSPSKTFWSISETPMYHQNVLIQNSSWYIIRSIHISIIHLPNCTASIYFQMMTCRRRNRFYSVLDCGLAKNRLSISSKRNM